MPDESVITELLQSRIDAESVKLLDDGGQLACLVTAHPDTAGISGVTGYTIKLDPWFPPGKIDIR